MIAALIRHLRTKRLLAAADELGGVMGYYRRLDRWKPINWAGGEDVT